MRVKIRFWQNGTLQRAFLHLNKSKQSTICLHLKRVSNNNKPKLRLSSTTQRLQHSKIHSKRWINQDVCCRKWLWCSSTSQRAMVQRNWLKYKKLYCHWLAHTATISTWMHVCLNAWKRCMKVVKRWTIQWNKLVCWKKFITHSFAMVFHCQRLNKLVCVKSMQNSLHCNKNSVTTCWLKLMLSNLFLNRKKIWLVCQRQCVQQQLKQQKQQAWKANGWLVCKTLAVSHSCNTANVATCVKKCIKLTSTVATTATKTTIKNLCCKSLNCVSKKLICLVLKHRQTSSSTTQWLKNQRLWTRSCLIFSKQLTKKQK